MIITCLGDSICYGYGVRPEHAWVTLLAMELTSMTPELRVSNAGINGETARDGLYRLDSLTQPAPNILYAQFGLNDAALGEPIDIYIETMHEIVDRALARGTQCVLVGSNHPVAPEEYFPGGETYRHAARLYNEALRNEFADAAWPVRFVDIEHMCEGLGNVHEQVKILQDDGDHLSLEGNRAYARFLVPIFKDCIGRI